MVMEGVEGVEPSSNAPKAFVLPLNDTPNWQHWWELNPTPSP